MTKSQHRGFSRRALIGSGAAASILAVSAGTAAASGQKALRIAASAVDRDAILRGPAVTPGLTTIGADGSLTARLVRHYAGENGGRRWRFDLDPEARFHDGASLSAATVAECLRPALPGARMRRGRGGQLVIDLTQPDLHLPYRLGHADFALIRADGIGAGAYRVTRAGGGSAVLAPVSGEGRVFEIIHIADPADRLAALRSRRVDLALDLPEDAHPAVEQDDLVLSMDGSEAGLARSLARLIGGEATEGPGRSELTVSLAPAISESAAARPLMRRMIDLAAHHRFALTPATPDRADIRIDLCRHGVTAAQVVRLPRHAGFSARPLTGPFSVSLIPLDRRFA